MCDPIVISKIRPTPLICFAFELLRRTSALSDCSATFVLDRQMEIDREIFLQTVPYPAMIQSDKQLTSPLQKSEYSVYFSRSFLLGTGLVLHDLHFSGTFTQTL